MANSYIQVVNSEFSELAVPCFLLWENKPHFLRTLWKSCSEGVFLSCHRFPTNYFVSIKINTNQANEPRHFIYFKMSDAAVRSLEFTPWSTRQKQHLWWCVSHHRIYMKGQKRAGEMGGGPPPSKISFDFIGPPKKYIFTFKWLSCAPSISRYSFCYTPCLQRYLQHHQDQWLLHVDGWKSFEQDWAPFDLFHLSELHWVWDKFAGDEKCKQNRKQWILSSLPIHT